jgi:hypothetical protein
MSGIGLFPIFPVGLAGSVHQAPRMLCLTPGMAA